MRKDKMQTTALPHGGNLTDAMIRFNRPREQWLDLSTGINPHPYRYPASALSPDAWHRLPEPDPQLAHAAQCYYNAPGLLTIAGTQAAIQALPQCRMRSHGAAKVAVSAPSYAEHAHRWTQAGHRVTPVTYDDLAAAAADDDVDVMVICNPNNPTGACVAPADLLAWHQQLSARGGWLVVDEAFGDTLPELGVAAYTDRPGLIVLRSIGKFFGLAGLRLGFVAVETGLRAALADQIGPWGVSGPAQQIGRAALADTAWQHAMHLTLSSDGARLRSLLQLHGVNSCGTALFQWWPMPQQQAQACWHHLAQAGIWARLFTDAAAGIRLGLPADEHGWQRLEAGLASWAAQPEAA